jgi:hypothetical protein
MTLAERVRAKVSSWRPAGDGRHSWGETFADAGWVVRLSAEHNDRVGCLAWELALERLADAPAGLTLKTWASEVAGRVPGLLEDLKLLEVDDLRQEAVLRSDAPTRTGDVVGYYEVKLHGLTRATVRRYEANTAAGTGRAQVAFALTHEALARLAGAIAG